ncbi:hypothetical protein C8J57DRAFT_1323564 [Mycena rebaudengoi]|nr:hypothetical protein C8J57DRAFT_1323564 [Mycena rebaudengoi]
MPLTLPDPLPSIELSHGPSFVGIIVGCMSLTRIYIHCLTLSSDRLWTKCYVGLLLLTDTVGTVLAVYWLYNLTMTNFLMTLTMGNHFQAYGDANWNPGIVGITGALCQLFYAWRIHVLTKQPMLTVVIVTVSLVGAIAAVGVSGTIGVVKLFSRFHARGMTIFGTIWLVSALASGYNHLMHLTWYLGRLHFVSSTWLIGIFCSAFALVELCFFLGQPDTGVHVGFSWILGKLYTNSVMASLNLRKQNRGYSEDNTTSGGNLSGTRRDGGRNAHRVDPNVVVHVSTEQHELTDAPYGWDYRQADDKDIYPV